MINYTEISIRNDRLERLRELADEPHLHYEGMNECSICDKSLAEALIDKIEYLQNNQMKVEPKNMQSGG